MSGKKHKAERKRLREKGILCINTRWGQQQERNGALAKAEAQERKVEEVKDQVAKFEVECPEQAELIKLEEQRKQLERGTFIRVASRIGMF